MPSKWFQSSNVVGEMTRPDFHTNRTWQPHRQTLCLSPVATISLPEPVSIWTVWAWTLVCGATWWWDQSSSINWTKPVTDQKPWGKKHAKTAASHKQAGPRRKSLYCKIKVFLSASVFEMIYTQILYEFLDACSVVWANFLTSHRMFDRLCIMDEMLERGMKVWT